MKIIKIPAGNLKENKKNYRIHSEKQIGELIRSIKMFGQIRPIVCDEDFIILAGHALLRALLQSGATEVSVLQMEGLTPEQKTRLLIADNRIQYRGGEDLDSLYSLMSEIGFDDVPGYEQAVLSSMMDVPLDNTIEKELAIMAAKKTNVEQEVATDGDETNAVGRTITCPNCGSEIQL